jgi:hypothetical protein
MAKWSLPFKVWGAFVGHGMKGMASYGKKKWASRKKRSRGVSVKTTKGKQRIHF